MKLTIGGNPGAMDLIEDSIHSRQKKQQRPY
jgi:hypothetical protein